MPAEAPKHPAQRDIRVRWLAGQGAHQRRRAQIMSVEAGNRVELDGPLKIVEPRREAPRVALLRNRPRSRVIIAKRIGKVAGAPPKPPLNGRIGFFHLSFDLSLGERPYIGMTRRMALNAQTGRLERLELVPIHEQKRNSTGLLLGPATFGADPACDHEN